MGVRILPGNPRPSPYDPIGGSPCRCGVLAGKWQARPEPVTHKGRQAVWCEAGAPKLRGICHAVGEGPSGRPARRAARSHAAPRTPPLTRG